ncbi:MAG: hypothetical protein WAO21_12030 [Verrucomicrobiia bacterium]
MKPTLKSGHEKFHANRKALSFTLSEFWKWSVSDLISNATRGRLAEFVVAKALRISTKTVRNEWGEYDLKLRVGKSRFLKLEIKSAAYVQTWTQSKPSSIQFEVKKRWVWNSRTKRWRHRRVADVYVFALLKEKHKKLLNPLDVMQWDFYVLPTEILNKRKRSQHSITLNSLSELTNAIKYYHLRKAVQNTQTRPKVRSGINKPQ